MHCLCGLHFLLVGGILFRKWCSVSLLGGGMYLATFHIDYSFYMMNSVKVNKIWIILLLLYTSFKCISMHLNGWLFCWSVYCADDYDISSSVADSVFESYPTAGKLPRPKLLQFWENRRPPYWGTWRKKSQSIGPKNPFSRDEVNKYIHDLNISLWLNAVVSHVSTETISASKMEIHCMLHMDNPQSMCHYKWLNVCVSIWLQFL